MKITCLFGYYPPEVTADAHLNHDIARDFAAYGAEVTVVAPFPRRGVGAEETAAYLEHREERVCEGLRVLRVGEPRTFANTLPRKTANAISEMRALYKAAKQIDTDVYVVVSSPPTLAYVAAKLSKTAQTVFMVRDIFPDNLQSVYPGCERKPYFKILRAAMRRQYAKIQAVSTLSEDMKATIEGYDAGEKAFDVTPIWMDADACKPVPKEENPLFDRFGLPRDGAFIVGYAGNIGRQQSIETIIEAAALLEKEVPDALFVLIGEGATKTAVEEKIRIMSIGNVRLFPFQPEEELPFVYSLGDIQLVSNKAGMMRYCLPSKIPAIWSAGRFAVCALDTDSRIAQTVEESGYGLCAAPEDPRSLADAIKKAYGMRGGLAEKESDIRAYVMEQYSRSKNTKKLFDFVRGLHKDARDGVE